MLRVVSMGLSSSDSCHAYGVRWTMPDEEQRETVEQLHCRSSGWKPLSGGAAEVELQMSDHWQRVQSRWLTCSQQALSLSCHHRYFSSKSENVDPDGSNFIHQQDYQQTPTSCSISSHTCSCRDAVSSMFDTWCSWIVMPFMHVCLLSLDFLRDNRHISLLDMLNVLWTFYSVVFSAVTGEQVASLSLSEQHVPETCHLKGQKHELSGDHRLFFWPLLSCNWHHRKVAAGKSMR